MVIESNPPALSTYLVEPDVDSTISQTVHSTSTVVGQVLQSTNEIPVIETEEEGVDVLDNMFLSMGIVDDEEEDTRSLAASIEDIEETDEITMEIDRPVTPHSIETYSNYSQHALAHRDFSNKFKSNKFGFACSVCDRLWFENDLTKAPPSLILQRIIDNYDERNEYKLCSTCKRSLKVNRVPIMSTYNGFKFPPKPRDLPPLDLISERLISPRLPFMQIRRLRHVNGQYRILGQIINVPVTVNNMVTALPRSVDNDYCINVHIKKRLINKSSYIHGLVTKNTVKKWLEFLIVTPLYLHFGITVDESFLNEIEMEFENYDEFSEHIPIEDSLTAQQQTLYWNEDKYLALAPGENSIPKSLLFDEYAEELSFPSIYLGQFRTFNDEIKATPFNIASSELRRSDRRAVTPQHLLYMAMKIMRIRVRDCLTVAFKHVGKDTTLTRAQIESKGYIQGCIESNLAFLRSIPNSAWYWSERKRELFAMIRQLFRPTMFLTMSANEIGWPDLLQTLYRLKNHISISEEAAADLDYLQKATLINEDAVTCAIYFNKLVNVIMSILQSKNSPFGKYRVKHYFKRIEFQHRGSPHAHILLWLENAPIDPLGADYDEAIKMIDELVSIAAEEASGHIKLQTHKH